MIDRSTCPRTAALGGAFLTVACTIAFACTFGREAPRQVVKVPIEPPPVSSLRGYTEAREACASHEALRQPFFGELHVHTRNSFDSNLWDVRGTPDDAYRFARGEVVAFPTSAAPRQAQLERPLDFAAVTDHAQFIGAVSFCSTPGTEVYDSVRCKIYRGEVPPPDPTSPLARLQGILAPGEGPGDFRRSPEICGKDASLCLERLDSVWDEIGASAERWYDRTSACEFTTFHAYEYTATPGLAKVHRNVVFRNATTPERPISYVDEPSAVGLWRKLRDRCLEAGNGCDVLAIPHNSNLSNGRMFTVDTKELPIEEQRKQASLRQRLEPLVEITQIKGDSECKNGMYGVVGAADEFCDYEKIRSFAGEVEDCIEGTSFGALAGKGCQSRLDFVRYALIEGIREQNRLGVNPYKLGIIASTDAHNANPGDVEEYSYQGWSGVSDDTPAKRLGSGLLGPLRAIYNNPGGLVGVWAEENSRDSIFDGMERRETFGTSGPRMTARFFGGWGFEKDLCDQRNMVARGYADGVAMGSDLPARKEAAAAPTFAISALRDPGTQKHPGGRLQRAQIVKGWLGDDGQFHQAVYDVAGGANDATVDLETCEPKGKGAKSLCGVWTDPDFELDRRAVYYARVLENPSCRWSQRHCNALPKDKRPPECDLPNVSKTIQERLWTSPIWYDPGPPPAQASLP